MTDTPWWHDEDGNPSGGDALGSAATEAARLFEVLRDRMMTDPNTLRAGMRMMEAFTTLRGGGGHPVQPGEAPECAYCPVCQAISHARNLDPQTIEKLTAAAMEFAETIRQTVSQPPADAEDAGVRHVPLDDDLSGGAEEPATDETVVDDDFLGWPVDDDPGGSGSGPGSLR